MGLYEALQEYQPFCEQEASDKEKMLNLLSQGTDCFTRENETAHFTASGWVVNKDFSKVLYAYHNIYDSWSWLGGHADGETDLLSVAQREVMEESGLTDVNCVSDAIFSIEILPVAGHEKRGKYVSSHLHYNITYLFIADEEQQTKSKPDENKAVGWFSNEEALSVPNEEWMVSRIYRKLLAKSRLFAQDN